MSIPLSKLTPPAINGLLKDPEEIMAEIVAWFSLNNYDLTAAPSDPAYRVLLAAAQRESNLRSVYHDAIQGLSLAYAWGAELDTIGGTYYGVERLIGEEDEAYRQRIADTPDRFAIGLSGGWYEQNAIAVPGVFAAQMDSPTPGVVNVYIQADETLLDNNDNIIYADGVPTQELLNTVTATITAPNIRQQTDDVRVLAATPIGYEVTVSLTPRSGPDASIVRAEAETALTQILIERDRLGEKINNAIIAGAVHVPGVYEASITITRLSDNAVVPELVAATGEFPRSAAVTVGVN
ncbi:baseplate J/gp47 family protein [Candidatus Persebacteraceae bacterium Df01]|jgi:phage-related baseplate assembly protein|uniref:Baseplate J/gp47 family protein n=1 Tax=Candidatus Doriopsillibacter californiensis TaxID=2970740 RepID=A0ABT7QLU8_9GAMM|nr:baseplate J/gp47 family protein [Candidatus Persebacteraceae bacterium Df01]